MISQRRLKLRTHAQTEECLLSQDGDDSPPELLISQDLDLTSGAIVVLSQRVNGDPTPEGVMSELTLKAKVNTNFRQQHVSLRGDIADRFKFRTMDEIFIKQLPSDARSLTLVELTFRDAYISRSDYWHFSDTLVNSCLYLDQILQYHHIKAQVLQLYDDTKKVNSGVISTNTRIVFRSSSAQIFLFIQLSAEMWHFDECGDIYFERALKKFIRPLVSNWQQKDCHHELTVVYFSRTIYQADSWEQFPEDVLGRDSIQVMRNGTFYQDFYKVIIQDEIRYDWSSIIPTLKREFFQYKRNIGLVDPDPRVPPSHNSLARYGNFLEAINLTLNIFELHYLDRILDRTGQQFAMITPSQGVFENTQELIEISERRILDFGIGTDIIFLTRQPLHAVPLFIYHDCNGEVALHPKYHVAAHWLNFSYLGEDSIMDSRPENFRSFEPFLKMPDDMINPFKRRDEGEGMQERGCRNPLGKALIDNWVDEKPKDLDMLTYMRLYDTQVWKESAELPQLWETFSQTTPLDITPSTSPNTLQALLNPTTNSTTPAMPESLSVPSRFSYTSTGPSSLQTFQTSQPHLIHEFEPRLNTLSSSFPHEQLSFPDIGSSLSSSIPEFTSLNSLAPLQPVRSLSRPITHSREINPFNRNCRLTQTSGSRRRWAHCFPASNKGIIVRDNYLKGTESPDTEDGERDDDQPIFEFSDFQDGFQTRTNDTLVPFTETKDLRRSDFPYNQSAPTCSSALRRTDFVAKKKLHRSYSAPDTLPTLKVIGEVEEAFVKRGINWKSLMHPALFPITNDFFPEEHRLLSEEYHRSPHNLSDTLAPTDKLTCDQQVLSALKELISQRLVCGFQLITTIHGNVFSINELLNLKESATSCIKLWLSLGEVYHELVVVFNATHNLLDYNANIFSPATNKRHKPINYVYNLWPLGRCKFEFAGQIFKESDLSIERWSHYDSSIWRKEYNQVIQQGDTFWSVQYILLPDHLPTDLFFCNGNSAKVNEWREAKFLNFTTFLDYINAAKQKISQRGSYSDPVKRRKNFLRSQSSGTEAIREKLLRCIRLENWSELVQSIQNLSNGFSGFFHLSTAGPNTHTNYFILTKLTDYLTAHLCSEMSPADVWGVVLTLLHRGLLTRFDSPAYSIQTNGYYICSFQGADGFTEGGKAKISRAHSAEQICAIEVLWDKTDFLSSGQVSSTPTPTPMLPPIQPDFNEGQRICPLLDQLAPFVSNSDTNSVHLSHDKAYSPLAGFRIEIQFRVASTSLLDQAVSDFKHYAQKTGYNFLLYPSCRTFSHLASHPFRRPYYIPLTLPPPYLKNKQRVIEIMTLIVLKFGFIKESYVTHTPALHATPSQLKRDRFTHYTGQYFISLVPPEVELSGAEEGDTPCSPAKVGYYSKLGFLWWNNFLLNRRTRGRVASREGNKDLASMFDFCSGLNGGLDDFLLLIENIYL